jgi:4-hydroxy-tetrahydrodipicolinate synthase
MVNISITYKMEGLFFPDGVHNVLVTPFDKNRSDKDNFDEPDVDMVSLTKLFDKNAEAGYQVQGIVLLGTTSETSTLDSDEQDNIIRRIWKINSHLYNDRKFITIGIGGNDTGEVLSNAEEYDEYCDAFMVTIPYYNKPQQRGIVKMFQRISKKYPRKPIMIYNIPSRTGTDLLPESMAEIVRTCPNVVALKEASGNWENVKKFCELISNYRKLGSTFKIFSGDDGNIRKVMDDFNGNGVISVAGNVYPHIVHNVVSGSLEHVDLLGELVKILFCESNPVPVKWLLAKKGYISYPSVREPLVEIEDESKINLNVLTDCDSVENDMMKKIQK